MRNTPLFWRISSARLAHLSHAACSVGVLPLSLPLASSMSSGFILPAGSLLLTKAQFSLAALPSEVSLPLHIVKADVVPARLLASAGNRGAARAAAVVTVDWGCYTVNVQVPKVCTSLQPHA